MVHIDCLQKEHLKLFYQSNYINNIFANQLLIFFFFSRCSFILNSKGKIETLNQVKQNQITKNIVEDMAKESLRTICIAYRDFVPKSLKSQDNSGLNVEYYDNVPDWNDEHVLLSYLTCICITGIEDPVRDEVKKTKIIKYKL